MMCLALFSDFLSTHDTIFQASLSCMHGIVAPVTIPQVDSIDFYFHRKAVIPIEMELAEDERSDDSESEKEDEDPNLQCYIQKMNDFRDELFKKAKSKIVDAQMKQKRDYDRKHGKRKVQTKAANCSICKRASTFAFGLGESEYCIYILPHNYTCTPIIHV